MSKDGAPDHPARRRLAVHRSSFVMNNHGLDFVYAYNVHIAIQYPNIFYTHYDVITCVTLSSPSCPFRFLLIWLVVELLSFNVVPTYQCNHQRKQRERSFSGDSD